jgi:cysteine desulfurase
MERVYFDNAATTRCDPRVAEVMLSCLTESFGNPNSEHAFGHKAAHLLEEARATTADCLGATPEELTFTAGGSAAIHLALTCLAQAGRARSNRVILTAVEHEATLQTGRLLGQEGFEVVQLPVDEEGSVELETAERELARGAAFLSVLHVQNEVGTLEPIEALGALAREAGVPFHLDAVQSCGQLPLDLANLPVDMLALSAHKFYGPKGIGALYIRRGLDLAGTALAPGGDLAPHAGTPDVAGAVGLATALKLATSELSERAARISKLRDLLIEEVLSSVPDARLSGPRAPRANGIAHFTFPGLEGEALVTRLDLKGYAVSTASACKASSAQPSHVLKAMGMPASRLYGALRVSLGKDNTAEEVKTFVQALLEAVNSLRLLAP